MHRLIAIDRHNADRIFPYLGGEEVNNHPRQSHRRWCIDFNDFPLKRENLAKSWAVMNERERAKCRTSGIVPEDYPEPVAADWPDLLAIVQQRVKPERDVQKRDALRHRWWQYADKRPALRDALRNSCRVLATNVGAAPHLAFVWLQTDRIYANTLGIIVDESPSMLSSLQSRAHETWARFFASSMKDDIRYTPSDCLETFAFPLIHELDVCLVSPAMAYHDHRATLMVARNEGLTKTYNRFHDFSRDGPRHPASA